MYDKSPCVDILVNFLFTLRWIYCSSFLYYILLIFPSSFSFWILSRFSQWEKQAENWSMGGKGSEDIPSLSLSLPYVISISSHFVPTGQNLTMDLAPVGYSRLLDSGKNIVPPIFPISPGMKVASQCCSVWWPLCPFFGLCRTEIIMLASQGYYESKLIYAEFITEVLAREGNQILSLSSIS